jgi:hypothetical protein
MRQPLLRPADSLSLGPPPLGLASLANKAYSPGQVTAAAFIGLPIAGCILLASNFTLFGAPERRSQALIWGFVSTIAVLLLAFVLPENFPNAVIPAAYTSAMQQIARKTQAIQFYEYIEAGGPKHSHWRVFGIGVACSLSIGALFFVVFMLVPMELVSVST